MSMCTRCGQRPATRVVDGGICTSCFHLDTVRRLGGIVEQPAAPLVAPLETEEQKATMKDMTVEVIRLFESGMKLNPIAVKTGCSWHSVRKILLEAGLYKGRTGAQYNGTGKQVRFASGQLTPDLVEGIWRCLNYEAKCELIGKLAA